MGSSSVANNLERAQIRPGKVGLRSERSGGFERTGLLASGDGQGDKGKEMADVDLNELGREAARYFEGLQGRICTAVEDLERRSGGTARFCDVFWKDPAAAGIYTLSLHDGLAIAAPSF